MDFPELISRPCIMDRISELSDLIRDDFKTNIYTLTVLEGAKVFSGYLIDSLKEKGCVIESDYTKLSSYENGTETSGRIILKKHPEKEFSGKKVLVIEDIIDTGLTLTFLKDYLLKGGAQEVKLCTLLDKPSRRRVELVPDYVGFEIPNEFVIGFGIDFNGKYRDLPSIQIFEEKKLF